MGFYPCLRTESRRWIASTVAGDGMTSCIKKAATSPSPSMMRNSEVVISKYKAMYYPASGGVVVANEAGRIVDAGLIREPRTELSEIELARWLRRWMNRTAWAYLRDDSERRCDERREGVRCELMAGHRGQHQVHRQRESLRW